MILPRTIWIICHILFRPIELLIIAHKEKEILQRLYDPDYIDQDGQKNDQHTWAILQGLKRMSFSQRYNIYKLNKQRQRNIE